MEISHREQPLQNPGVVFRHLLKVFQKYDCLWHLSRIIPPDISVGITEPSSHFDDWIEGTPWIEEVLTTLLRRENTTFSDSDNGICRVALLSALVALRLHQGETNAAYQLLESPYVSGWRRGMISKMTDLRTADRVVHTNRILLGLGNSVSQNGDFQNPHLVEFKRSLLLFRNLQTPLGAAEPPLRNAVTVLKGMTCARKVRFSLIHFRFLRKFR